MSAAESKAVFLSYASQDADAARRVCDALRAAGVEVWFDQNELRGGDAWDQKIRRQIKECALFVPIISANTEARPEGYFRLEWLLAVERARLMADDHPFLFPVVVDHVAEGTARVPGKFRDVQWTPLPDAASRQKFARLVQSVLQPAVPTLAHDTAARGGRAPLPAHSASRRRRLIWPWAAGGALLVGIAFALLGRRAPPAVSRADAGTATVAVLPFVVARTVATDVELADSLHDDVISALARIRALHVLSRDAVQPYGEPAQRNHRTIAQQLGATTLVDVSLAREGGRVKLEARMLNTRSGALAWAETFHSEVASPAQRAELVAALTRKIATGLHIAPAAMEEATLPRPATSNAEAYALYQRARLNLATSRDSIAKNEERIRLLRAALAKDPNLVGAYVQLVDVHALMYWFASMDHSPARKSLAKEALDQAVRLAPDAPETQLARGIYLYRCERDYRRALEAFHGAEQSLPGDAKLKEFIGFSQRRLGRLKESLAALEEALVLEPRSLGLFETIIETCFHFRRFDAVLDYGRRYREMGGNSARRFLARAAYEVSGDKAQFEKDMFPYEAESTSVSALRARYGLALLREDFAEAARLLDEPRIWSELRITRVDPSLRLDAAPAVHRAYLALARSDREAAKTHANDALKRLALEVPSEESGYMVRIASAEMMAIAGRGEEAVVAMKKALAEINQRDAFDGMKHQHRLACVYAAAGMPREALEQLARLMQQPCDAVPSELREEPMLASLRALPEFERILGSARKL